MRKVGLKCPGGSYRQSILKYHIRKSLTPHYNSSRRRFNLVTSAIDYVRVSRNESTGRVFQPFIHRHLRLEIPSVERLSESRVTHWQRNRSPVTYFRRPINHADLPELARQTRVCTHSWRTGDIRQSEKRQPGLDRAEGRGELFLRAAPLYYIKLFLIPDDHRS